MKSWHKVGQKVAVVGEGWIDGDDLPNFGPSEGEVCTIENVELTDWGVAFDLKEWPREKFGNFVAHRFRPVYPTAIGELRKLNALSPKRVKEDA